MKIKKAVIVAAGKSSRLYPLTLNKPKGLLEINSLSLIKRSVLLLLKNKIFEIAVVVGFKRQMLMEELKEFSKIKYIYNPFFEETNNMASLWLAHEFINGDPFVYLHNDIIYEENILQSCLSNNGNVLVVDAASIDLEGMKVYLENGRFVKSSKEIPLSKAGGEWIGITVFKKSSGIFNTIENLLEEKRFQDYDTAAFNQMVVQGELFEIVYTNNSLWKEIDTIDDFKDAQKKFLNEISPDRLTIM